MLRTRSEHTSSRVTTVELFFDLVFVFAVTQLSHRLLAHLDGLGAIQTALLSFPKIISARSDDAIRTELVWQ
jgi:low temperature requirement protein LtrA